jgi:hypothetical protein
VLDDGFQELVAFFADGLRAVSRPSERIRHVVVVAVDRCQPLVSPAYDTGATERDVSQRWEAYFTELWAERRG